MRVQLDSVHTVKRRLKDGSIRLHFYHRITRDALPGKPGSAEFIAAWQAAEARLKQRPKGDTIGWLIDQFQDAPEWTSLRQSTRTISAYHLAAIEKSFGDFPLAALSERGARSEFLAWRDGMATTPRAADAKLATLQRVLSFGLDRGLIDENPIASFRRIYAADRSDKIWLPEHVSALQAAASREISDAMLIALHTGQRQGDLLRMTWSAFDGQSITLIQSKTRKRVYIPCTKALLAILTRLEASSGGCVTILRSAKGRPWSSDAFKKAWRAAFADSGINADLHFHDLRGTAVTMLAEAGCTVPEIAAITGHSLSSAGRILEVYLSKTRALASAAILKLNEHARNTACKRGVNAPGPADAGSKNISA